MIKHKSVSINFKNEMTFC